MPQDKYPFAPDEEDINRLNPFEVWTPDRIEKQLPDKKDVAYMGDNEDFLREIMPIPFKQDRLPYDFYAEVCKITNGFTTIYKPDNGRKYSAFEATRPEDQLGDQLLFENEYDSRPDDADIKADFPTYTKHFSKILNFSPEKQDRFSKLPFYKNNFKKFHFRYKIIFITKKL